MGWLPQHVVDSLKDDGSTALIAPKRGDAIFEGTDYPREWADFIGQEDAKEQLQIRITAAIARGSRLDHMLVESGVAGVGKTTLATLTAYQMGVGFLQASGPISVDKARELLKSMSDRDILFLDEVHTMVAGNKTRADWILPLMTEGKLYTDRGAETMPDVTIMAATTDVGRLPATMISRFMIRPAIVEYTNREASLIAINLAGRMGVDLPADIAPAVARAADKNPRVMRKILIALRDLQEGRPGTEPDIEKALKWAGVSYDGLSTMCLHILMILATSKNHTASIDTIKGKLGEPGPLRHEEQMLLQRDLIAISGTGRTLTDAGRRRALEEAQ